MEAKIRMKPVESVSGRAPLRTRVDEYDRARCDDEVATFLMVTINASTNTGAHGLARARHRPELSSLVHQPPSAGIPSEGGQLMIKVSRGDAAALKVIHPPA
jgi:hypothetical protein